MNIYAKLSTVFSGLFILFSAACHGQTNAPLRQPNLPGPSPVAGTNTLVGGGCDGCEIMYVGMPSKIDSVSRSPGWSEKGQKLLITGTVYEIDGKTPAPGVVIYYWQTDANGFYSPREGMDEAAKRHGHIRGWVKTDQNGKYSIYTIRPAPYPNRDIPAHIHTSIKEPNIGNEYYIDEFVFDDDKLLTSPKRRRLENRGGSGVLRVVLSGDLQIAEHNIILGLNIPNYPQKQAGPESSSGLQIGEDSPSFTPVHAWGPDKGSRACPVCQYGRFLGILYFVGNHPNWSEIKRWLVFFESQSAVYGKYLKVYFIYGNEKDFNEPDRQKQLEQFGQELNLKSVALTFVPSLSDRESSVWLNKINPAVENTIVTFRRSNIVSKFVNFKPTAANFKEISNVLETAKSIYLDLPEPEHQ